MKEKSPSELAFPNLRVLFALVLGMIAAVLALAASGALPTSEPSRVTSARTVSEDTKVPRANFADRSPDPRQEAEHPQLKELVQSMHLIAGGTGWVLTEGHLLWTTTSGREWRDISPSTPRAKILSAFFLDSSTGWSVLTVRDVATNLESAFLASTSNGGQSWAVIQLLSATDYAQHKPAGQVAIQFVSSIHGWIMVKLESSSNFSRGLLLESSDGGNTWQCLPEPPAGDPIRFVNDKEGWIAGGPGRDHLYVTRDGGRSWSQQSVNASSQGFQAAQVIYDLPTFANATDGILPVTFARSTNCVIDLFSTSDGGRTWLSKKALSFDDGISGGNRIAAAIISSNLAIVASPTDSGLSILEDDTITAKHATVTNLGPNVHIAQMEFVARRVGWLLVGGGKCAGFKKDCTQQVRLLATDDGGETLVDITPSVLPEELQRDESSRLSGGSPESVIISENRKGFDQCQAATVNNMQVWWTNSPYWDANIYFGGVNRSCSQPNLTSSWVSQVFAQGWGLIPTWVGPQATCTTCTSCSVMSSDPTTAASQGVNEANSAATAAAALGLTNTIIYYDMERYTPNTTCQTAVRAFINAWVQQMHARGNLAGVYGSPQNAQDDWSVVANRPDAVWIAKWDGNISVFGLTPLIDSLWPSHQRIHQYLGGHNETWGGVTFNIDNDFEDAPVAGPGGTTPSPPTVQTLPASSVTSSSAVINGTVTNNGGAPVDHYYFYYWINPNSPIGIDDSGITVSGNSFSAQIAGLSPASTYQFRAFAHNSSTVNLGFGVGWGSGSIVSFQTGSTGSTSKPDFNGDANADILWQNNSTGQHTIWFMNGTSYMASADLFTTPLAWQIATTGDFNNDGKVDIYWQNTQTGQIAVQLMNGTATTGWVDFTFPTAWKIVGTGDFNGDSKTDILWENTQNGQVTIWLLNGTTTVGWVDLFFNVPLTWTIVGTGDFNGDGKVDILWRNAQTGQRTIQLMNGTVTMGWADLSTVPNIAWQIAGVSDFNRDGKVDILWQNLQTAQRTIELMNGTTTMGWADLPQGQPAWEMRNH